MNRNNRNGNNGNGNNGNGNNRNGKNGNGNNANARFQQLQNEVNRNNTIGITQIANPESNNSMRKAYEFINDTRSRFNATQAERNEVERQMKETAGHVKVVNKILFGTNAGPAAVANAAAPIEELLYENNAAAAAADINTIANRGIPAKKSSLTDEEIRDFDTLKKFKLELIKERINKFKRDYLKARKQENENYKILSEDNSNTNVMRPLVCLRIIENATEFSKIILYIDKFLNPRKFKKAIELSEIMTKYRSICSRKIDELKIICDTTKPTNTTRHSNKNGNKKNGNNKNSTRRNTKNVGCSGFGCLPWFSGTRKTSKVTPL